MTTANCCSPSLASNHALDGASAVAQRETSGRTNLIVTRPLAATAGRLLARAGLALIGILLSRLVLACVLLV